MPSLNMSVQRLKVAILPLDVPCSGPVTHSGKILTTGKSHGKKPDRFSLSTIVSYDNIQTRGKLATCLGFFRQYTERYSTGGNKIMDI